jgi:hypothetical protein
MGADRSSTRRWCNSFCGDKSLAVVVYSLVVDFRAVGGACDALGFLGSIRGEPQPSRIAIFAPGSSPPTGPAHYGRHRVIADRHLWSPPIQF